MRFRLITQKYPKSNWSLQASMTCGEIFLNQLFLPDSAAKVFHNILEHFPGHDNRALALLALGNVELAKNQLKKAEDFYNQGLRVLIRNARLQKEVQINGQLKLAEIAFFKKDYESAKKNLQSILKTQSRNMSNVFINDALELLLLIEENASEYPNALGEYANAMLLKKQNKIRESADHFESISASFSEAPLTPQALFQSAQLKEKLGDFLSAVFDYQSIVQNHSTSTLCDLSFWQIGRIQEEELKDISKAIESYESILLNYPESMLAEKARKKIRDLEGKS
jgi:TolA-binding protein